MLYRFNIYTLVYIIVYSIIAAEGTGVTHSLSQSETFLNQEVTEYIESICTLTDCTLVLYDCLYIVLYD